MHGVNMLQVWLGPLKDSILFFILLVCVILYFFLKKRTKGQNFGIPKVREVGES